MSARSKIHALMAATALSAVMAAAPALAQEATADQSTAPEDQSAGVDNPADIIVTARRSEEKLQDVPISITVFNQQQLTNRNITNSAELGTYTPSLSTNQRYGPEKASFVIRGFVQDLATQPSVGVYFADVVAPRSGGSTTSGGGVGVGAMFDLQNVQVLKGPQGTLFGRNTTGGAVLLVPQKPTDKLEGYVEGSYGNYDMKRVQAVVNIPLADTFRVRLGVDHMVRDGYLINHSGIGPGRLGNSDYWSARLSIVGELTPDLENYFIGNYSVSDNAGVVSRIIGCNRNPVISYPTAATVGNVPPVPDTRSVVGHAFYGCAQLDRQNNRGDGPWDVESNQIDPKSRQETWQVINTTTWRVSDNVTVKNIASYAEFRETTRYSLWGENFLNPDGTVAYRAISLNNQPGYNNASQNTYTEELQVQGESSDNRLKWQVGGYFENSDPLGFTAQTTSQFLNCTDMFNFQCAAGVPNPQNALFPGQYNQRTGLPEAVHFIQGSISPPFQKTWFRSRGLYAQGTYDLTDKLSVTAGIRYTWDTMTHRYDQVSAAFVATNVPRYTCANFVRLTPGSTASIVIPNLAAHDTCNVTFTSKTSAPTWLFNVDYKPTDDVLLYAKWARGYRAGGVASANILFETWQPEKVDTYEIGAKTSWRGGAVNGYFNAAAFYNNFTNQQIAASLIRSANSPLIGGSAILNAGKSRIWGFEIDSSLTFFEHFRLDLGYTYLNTRVQSITAPDFAALGLSDFYSAIVPSASAGSRLALSPNHRLTVTGTYTLPLDPSLGKVSVGVTWVHTSDQVLNLATITPFQTAPATNLVNLNLNWNDVGGLPVDLSAFVTNLTNEAFPVAVNGAYQSAGIETAIFNQPRMYGLRLRYKFGR